MLVPVLNFARESNRYLRANNEKNQKPPRNSQAREGQLMPPPTRRREWLPLLQQEQRPAKGLIAGGECYFSSCSRMDLGAVGGGAELAP